MTIYERLTIEGLCSKENWKWVNDYDIVLSMETTFTKWHCEGRGDYRSRRRKGKELIWFPDKRTQTRHHETLELEIDLGTEMCRSSTSSRCAYVIQLLYKSVFIPCCSGVESSKSEYLSNGCSRVQSVQRSIDILSEKTLEKIMWRLRYWGHIRTWSSKKDISICSVIALSYFLLIIHFSSCEHFLKMNVVDFDVIWLISSFLANCNSILNSHRLNSF
jgi:hypothetical protein